MTVMMILQANKVRAARADLQEAVDDDDVPWLYTAASTNHVRQSHFQHAQVEMRRSQLTQSCTLATAAADSRHHALCNIRREAATCDL